MKYVWSDNDKFSCYFDEDNKSLNEFNSLIQIGETQIVATISHSERGIVAKKIFDNNELSDAKSWVEHELPFQIMEEEKKLFEKAEVFRKKYKDFLRECWSPGGVYCTVVEEAE